MLADDGRGAEAEASAKRPREASCSASTGGAAVASKKATAKSHRDDDEDDDDDVDLSTYDLGAGGELGLTEQLSLPRPGGGVKKETLQSSAPDARVAGNSRSADP